MKNLIEKPENVRTAILMDRVTKLSKTFFTEESVWSLVKHINTIGLDAIQAHDGEGVRMHTTGEIEKIVMVNNSIVEFLVELNILVEGISISEDRTLRQV